MSTCGTNGCGTKAGSAPTKVVPGKADGACWTCNMPQLAPMYGRKAPPTRDMALGRRPAGGRSTALRLPVPVETVASPRLGGGTLQPQSTPVPVRQSTLPEGTVVGARQPITPPPPAPTGVVVSPRRTIVPFNGLMKGSVAGERFARPTTSLVAIPAMPATPQGVSTPDVVVPSVAAVPAMPSKALTSQPALATIPKTPPSAPAVPPPDYCTGAMADTELCARGPDGSFPSLSGACTARLRALLASGATLAEIAHDELCGGEFRITLPTMNEAPAAGKATNPVATKPGGAVYRRSMGAMSATPAGPSGIYAACMRVFGMLPLPAQLAVLGSLPAYPMVRATLRSLNAGDAAAAGHFATWFVSAFAPGTDAVGRFCAAVDHVGAQAVQRGAFAPASGVPAPGRLSRTRPADVTASKASGGQQSSTGSQVLGALGGLGTAASTFGTAYLREETAQHGQDVASDRDIRIAQIHADRDRDIANIRAQNPAPPSTNTTTSTGTSTGTIVAVGAGVAVALGIAGYALTR